MLADLHCHTKLSDGSLGIDDIMTIAAGRGVEAISVADTDCIAGTSRAVRIGSKRAIRVIPGAELTAFDPESGGTVCILAYNYNDPSALEKLCYINTKLRTAAMTRTAKLVSVKYRIPLELINECAKGSAGLFEQHIMLALMHAGFTDSIYGNLYFRIFSQKSPVKLYAEPEFTPVSEVIACVHEAGGKAVLARPDKDADGSLTARLAGLGLDGVEAFAPSVSEEVSAAVRKAAAEKGLFVTGGSDFRGLFSRYHVSPGAFSTPDDVAEKLLAECPALLNEER